MKSDNASIVGSHFSDNIIRLNRLDDFREWFFYPGMLYGRKETWWGKGGERPDPHVGMDICYYLNTSGEVCRLNETSKVPVMFDGIVYAVSDDDFLGKSIFVRHDVKDKASNYLHSVYAHSTPYNGLVKNTMLVAGDVVATIADIRNRKLSIPGHLHISMVWLPEECSMEFLKWQHLSKTANVQFIDPIEYLAMNYSVTDYNPNKDDELK